MSSLSKQEVKCRSCGHRILSREIMRTDLYERAPGQNYVYVKFRCRRCKRLGQTFVPEARWDWTLLEPARDELSEPERERLAEAGPISDTEFLDFHLRLKNLDDLTDLNLAPPTSEEPSSGEETANEGGAEEAGEKRREDPQNERRGVDGKNSNELNGTPGEKQPDDHGING
ncbi:MAG TPA: hypothetical protein VGB77_21725 [Abditibacteriaceae bacterium]